MKCYEDYHPTFFKSDAQGDESDRGESESEEEIL